MDPENKYIDPPKDWQSNADFYSSPENCEKLDTLHLQLAYDYFTNAPQTNFNVTSMIDWILFLRIDTIKYRQWQQLLGKKV